MNFVNTLKIDVILSFEQWKIRVSILATDVKAMPRSRMSSRILVEIFDKSSKGMCYINYSLIAKWFLYLMIDIIVWHFFNLKTSISMISIEIFMITFWTSWLYFSKSVKKILTKVLMVSHLRNWFSSYGINILILSKIYLSDHLVSKYK